MDIAIPTLPSRSLPATLAFYRRLGFSGKLDTSPQIEQRQIDAWRQMSPADKAATITALTRAAYRDAGALVSWGRWYVFGAQAVVAYGVPRLSADVDVTVQSGPGWFRTRGRVSRSGARSPSAPPVQASHSTTLSHARFRLAIRRPAF